VEFAHAPEKRLSGHGILADLDGGILPGELGQGRGQFHVIALGPGLDRGHDDGFGKADRFEDDGTALQAERVPRGEVFHGTHGRDVAGIDLGDFLPLVGVHLQEARQAFLFILPRVVDHGADLGFARVHAQEGQASEVGIVHDLEDERGKGLAVGSAAGFDRVGPRMPALNGRDVLR